MKLVKKLSIISAVAASLLATAGCSNNAKTSSPSSSKDTIPSKITKKTTITFWHGMTGPLEGSLKKLTAEFEKENPNIKVKLENQNSYQDLHSKITSTMQSPKNLPTITQAYPGWLYTAAKNNMLVDLTPYINNSKIGWGSSKKSQIKADLLKGAQINGKQYGIPFNKSVEILIYNKQLLEKYGVKVPKTTAELKAAAKKIYEKSNHKVAGAGFDVLATYYTLEMKAKGHNFNSNIDFTGKDSKAVINYYANGVKDGYFKIAGSQKYLSTPFANQKIAMYVGSSAGEAFVKKGVANKFEYGVAARPTEYNMPQGTDIYMFNQASAMQKAAAFKYIKFLTSKASQLKWASQTGYIPVNTQALNSAEYKNSKAVKAPKILSSNIKKLYTIPVVKNSDSAFSDLTSIMESILSQAAKGNNIDSAIKAGKAKFDSDWKQ
ncbi:ABC transporter substrate-binding protein [Lactobacillus psittaci]|uniref:Sugar ABC superfamily ATP binding cassette transporter, permease protein n=1 Tax=Lactobacillus psittaci DSM 15354 TaxID=1122152 RepID=A0A0R1RXD4_9LACO|nr:ABC transporter substrate-binding protein [Lactobacillus psittaci]KRL61654.1 sugar ABC superfamily ATP binding cassette transporter, permease protein [Lactobacillus psittaci DSM 15354]